MQDKSDRNSALLAYYFGIRPWEHDLLTVRQFNALCDEAERLMKEGASRG